jgi:DNA-binding helix-hairpin-helix protein with protein kinase domain
MVRTFVNAKGAVIRLGRELNKGGEGSIFEVANDSGRVAKIYHRVPDGPKQAKLKFMASIHSRMLATYSAWPQETLHDAGTGQVIGFLMPKISGRAPIHMLYSPAHRRQKYPKAAWDFLLFVARNTAVAFDTLHDNGHVVGDVNQGNLMVGSDSKVVLIDCDSYQIDAGGELHLCEVGVSHFTPPELQGSSSFKDIQRTFNHDNFGLALIIFHILFGGRHPYSGVPLRRNVGEALESDIEAYRFAYSDDASSRGIEPPPQSISLSLVPSELQSMFTVAFTESGAQGGRPSAKQWITALDALRAHLKTCSASTMHVYPDHLKACPWCLLEQKGIIYFIDLGGVDLKALSASKFVLSDVGSAIEAIPAPCPIIVPQIKARRVKPRPLPPRIVTGRIVLVRIMVVCASLGLLVIAPALWFLAIAAGWAGWAGAGEVGQSVRTAEKRRRRQHLNAARKEFDACLNRLRTEVGPEGFAAKKQELQRLCRQHKALAEQEKRQIAILHTTAKERQMQKHLERCFIDTAVIKGVGPARKAALRSFGIETAADVHSGKVQTVKGFSAALTRSVVDWKKACESRFVFNPQKAVTQADKNAVRARILAHQRMIENTLLAAVQDLQQFRLQAIRKTPALMPLLNRAAEKLAQAQADAGLKSIIASAVRPTP